MYKPVLHLKNNHYGSNTWDCFSYKLNRDVCLYSDLEYELWIKLETDNEVENFCEQPLRISGVVDGETHDTIFDMWVKLKNGKEEFIEIKYSSDLIKMQDNKTRIYKQINLQKNWCKEKNISYRILTENEIRSQPLINNLKLIVPYIKYFNNISELEIHKLFKSINETPQALYQLIKSTNQTNTNQFYTTLFFLYYQKKISMNLDEIPFNQDTKVWINDVEKKV